MNPAILLERPLRKAIVRLHLFASLVLLLSVCFLALKGVFIEYLSSDELVIPSQKPDVHTDVSTEPASLSIFEKRPLKETLFLPELVNSIHCYQRPSRPDREEKGCYFAFANEPFFYLAYGKGCYLTLTSKGFELASSETPLQLKLLEDGKTAMLDLGVVTSDNVEVLSVNHAFPVTDFPNVVGVHHSTEFSHFCNEIEQLQVYPPDSFFSIYGGDTYGKKGRLFRLGNLDKHVYGIEPGSIFTLQCGALVPLVEPKNASCFMLRIASISSARVEIEAWNTSGKEYAVLGLIPQGTHQLSVKPEELFKDIRVRGGQRALVKVGKKTKLLRPGDYLLRQGSKWKLIDEKDGLERLINYLNCGMLFVFEGVFQKGRETLFTGRLFDETRSVQKKVELPVKVRKNKQAVERSSRPSDLAGESYEELPPEIEELLEELDDL